MAFFLLPAVAFGATVWQSTDDHGGIMYCDGNQRMTGFCAPGSTRDCWQDGGAGWEAGKLACSDAETAVSPTDPKWVLSSEHGDDISCNVALGYSAIGVCSSGRRWDCRCTGTSDEGCTDRWAWQSHMLRCAKGVELDLGAPIKELTARDWGADISCPDGYVAYRICSSGRDRNCQNKYNQAISHLLGCVKVKAAPKRGSAERVIREVKGYWEPLTVHNKDHKYKLVVAKTDSEGKELTKSESEVYSFSQELSVAVKVGIAALGDDGGVETTASFGASQEFGKEVADSFSQTWSITKTDERELTCGSATSGFETLYQWIMETETEDGNAGPKVQTYGYVCVKGVSTDPDSPRCVPGFCMNDHQCDICEYDYCKITGVRDDPNVGAVFEFDTDCGDLKLATTDWETGTTFQAELVRGEFVRDKDKGLTKTTVVKSGLIKLMRAEGTSSGYWTGSDNDGNTPWVVGDRVRVIKKSTVARRSTTEIISSGFVLVGVPAVAVFLLTLSFSKWSKTHSEIDEKLLA